MNIYLKSLSLFLGMGLLLASCEKPNPLMQRVKVMYSYPDSYVDAFVGSANILAHDKNLYQKHFRSSPKMHSLHMLDAEEWSLYRFENKFRINHKEKYESLSEEQLQEKIAQIRSGTIQSSGKYQTYLDSFEVRNVRIKYQVKEWTDSVSKQVIRGNGKIKYFKRSIGQEAYWIPKEIQDDVYIRTDYCLMSSFANSVYFDEETNRPESKVDLFFEVAHCPDNKYLRYMHTLNLRENTSGNEYFGIREHETIPVGFIRSKDQEIQFDFLKSRLVSSESELKEGKFWSKRLYLDTSQDELDSLTFEWTLKMDTLPGRFTTSPIESVSEDSPTQTEEE